MSIPDLFPGDRAALPATIRVDDRDLPVWPSAQAIAPMEGKMAVANFDDHGSYGASLAAAILRAEQDARFRDATTPKGFAAKVRGLPRWGAPPADLVHARALTLAYHVLGRQPVYVDNVWASVYRAGDYCMPHSHRRSDASIIYMLDPGDVQAPGEKTLAGALGFADARLEYCCAHESGRVTRLYFPQMLAGTMLIFSGEYVHFVNPYLGQQPRITLSWNITLTRLPGDPAEGWT